MYRYARLGAQVYGMPLEKTCDDCGVSWKEETLSAASQRKYLNSLSNLYRRAISEGFVPPGYNPVAALMEKPIAEQREAPWLEVHDAALFLAACGLHKPAKDKHGTPATFFRRSWRRSCSPEDARARSWA